MSMFGCDWMSRATAAEVLPLERRPEPALLPSSDEAVPVIPNDPCSNTRLHRVLAPILSPHDVRRVVQFALSSVDAPSPRADHRSEINMLLSVGIASSLGLYGHVNVNDIPDASDEDYSAHAYLQDIVRMCLLAETNEISVKEVSEHLMACRAMLGHDEGSKSGTEATNEANDCDTKFPLPSLGDVPSTCLETDMLQNSNASSNNIAMKLQSSVPENNACNGTSGKSRTPDKMLASLRSRSLGARDSVPMPTLLTPLVREAGVRRVLQLARLSLASSKSQQKRLGEVHNILSIGATMSLALYGHCDLVDIAVADKDSSTVEYRLQQVVQIGLFADENGISAKKFHDELTALSTTMDKQTETNDDKQQDTSHLVSETNWDMLKEVVRLSLFGKANAVSSDELELHVIALRLTLEEEEGINTRTKQTTTSNDSESTVSFQNPQPQESSVLLPRDDAVAQAGFSPAMLAELDKSGFLANGSVLSETSVSYDSNETANANPVKRFEDSLSNKGVRSSRDRGLIDNPLMKTQALDGMFAPLECPLSNFIPSTTVIAHAIIAHAKLLVHTMAAIADIIKAPKRIALLDESASVRFAPVLMAIGKIKILFQGFVWTSENAESILVQEQMEKAMAQLLKNADEILTLYELFIAEYDDMVVFLTTNCKESNADDMLERPLFEIESFIELVVLLVRAGRGPGKSEPPYARAVVAALRRLGTRPIWNDFLLRLRTRYSRRFNAWVFRNGNQVLGKQGDWRLLKRGEVRIKVLPWIWIRYTLYLFDHVLIWTPTRPSTKTAGLMQLFSDLRLGLGGRNHNEVSIISPVSSHTQPASLRFICSSQTEAVMWILRIEGATVFRPSSPPEDRTGVCISSSSVVHGPFDRRHNFRVGIDLEWHTDLETIVELQRPIGEGSLGAASLCVFLDTKEPWVVELVEAVDMERLKLILSPFFNGVEGSVEYIFGVGGPDPGHSNKFWILKEYIEGGTLQRITEIQPLDMRQIGYLTLGLIKALAAIHSRNLWYGELEFGSILVSCQGTIKLAIPRRFRPDLLKVSYKETRSARRIKKLQEEDIRFIGCVVSNLVSLYRAVLPARDKKPSAKLALWAKFIIYCASSGTTLDILASHPFVLFDEESEAYVRCRLLQMVLNMRSANNFARC